MKRCIWCERLNDSRAIEHIIPEALGCPSDFVLKDGSVCDECNNKLGHLDKAVIDEFDIVVFQAGVRRKRNRPPEIKSRGNLVGEYGPEGKFLVLNMESYPVKGPKGSLIAPYRGGDRNVKGTIQRVGDVYKLSFSVPIGKNKKFRRGIVKIGFSSFAYFLGLQLALSRDFDPIRQFVKTGKGERPILLMPSGDTNYLNRVWPPYQNDMGQYAITFRIAFVEFLVDLSPQASLFPELKAKAEHMYGKDGWGYLPLDA